MFTCSSSHDTTKVSSVVHAYMGVQWTYIVWTPGLHLRVYATVSFPFLYVFPLIRESQGQTGL